MDPIPDRDPLQNSAGSLTGLKDESPVGLVLSSGTVNHAIMSLTALGSNDDRLSQVVDIPVPVPRERSVRQLNDVPVDGCINGTLDGGKVSGAVGLDNVDGSVNGGGNKEEDQ
jgi:hypothetical protein